MSVVIFQSTRLSRASTMSGLPSHNTLSISIHKALASLDLIPPNDSDIAFISIHKALASLDGAGHERIGKWFYFNPQGSREPRPFSVKLHSCVQYFNPQGSREPRPVPAYHSLSMFQISIHKALASLDPSMWEPGRKKMHFNPQGSREPRRKRTPCF